MRIPLIGQLTAVLLLVGTSAADAQVTQQGPSPAVVKMRSQWLNPEINSFTFRDTDRVFESRPVKRSGPVRALARGAPMRMPSIQFGGQTRDYQRFSEDTFTNALLVIRDGKIVFEDLLR